MMKSETNNFLLLDQDLNSGKMEMIGSDNIYVASIFLSTAVLNEVGR